MTDIDVPDWVVRSVAGAMEEWHNNPANETSYNDTMKAALRAALSAWVVPAAYRAVHPNPDWPSQAWSTYREGLNLPAPQGSWGFEIAYKLRQEKPE